MKKKAADRVYGLAAALAVFEQRPQAVLNIAHTRAARRPLAGMLREAARRRIAYRELDDEALAQLAESVHHEGVCLLVQPAGAVALDDLGERAGSQALLVALDEVQNPHNFGAVLRSAAYFGVRGLIATEERKLTPSARRVAEGGAEHVPLALVPALPPALRKLRDEGWSVFGADPRGRAQLHSLRWPKRAVIVLGHERTGLNPPTRDACQTLVRVAGTEAVESLNVSVAAGVFFASYAQQHGFGE